MPRKLSFLYEHFRKMFAARKSVPPPRCHMTCIFALLLTSRYQVSFALYPIFVLILDNSYRFVHTCIYGRFVFHLWLVRRVLHVIYIAFSRNQLIILIVYHTKTQ